MREEGDGEKENQEAVTPPPPGDAERREEAKLKAKYPGLKTRGGGRGGSFLAQKKLQRGHKFFDSGDYNLVKGKKPGLSGATAGVSQTKPEKVKETSAASVPVSTAELGQDIPTADAIISRRMALFRTKSESNANDTNDDIDIKVGRTLRSGSMFVSNSVPQIAHVGGVRRGSMFPIGQNPTLGSDVIPSPEMLSRRRQSMIPAIPSKLTQ